MAGTTVLQQWKQYPKFAKQYHANLTIMPQGEHWFLTEKQMSFLDKWITENQFTRASQNR